MATLKVIQAEPSPPKQYVLTMAEAEARAVRTLTGGVLGRGPFRQACDAVWHQLDQALHGEECANVEGPDIEVTPDMNRYVEEKE